MDKREEAVRIRILTCPRSTNLKKRRAFTLIELLVVIGIAGALFLLSLQVLQKFMGRSLSGSSEISVEGLLYNAREKALYEGKTLTLVIDINEKTVGLQNFSPEQEDLAEEDSSEVETEEEESQPEWILKPQKVPLNLISVLNGSGILVSKKTAYIHFYPDGSNDPFFLEIDRENNRFLYLPPMRSQVVYLDNLSLVNLPEK